jgi:hypothetical protein
VERIEGDFFSVMGLPIRLVLRLMDEAGEKYEFSGAAGQRGGRAVEDARASASSS